MKQGKINDKFYQRLRSTGPQPASFFGLAKTHEKDTPLPAFLSKPGSCYHNLITFLAPFFQKLSGANIETNPQEARKALESLILEDEEQILFADAKSLYTNVPVGEAIETAIRELYSSNLVPDIPRCAMKCC